MTYQPLEQPIGYYSNPQPQSRRPGVVTALAVIGIIYAAIGLLNQGGGLIMMMTGIHPATGFAAVWGAIDSSVRLILAVVLLIGSIRALRLAPWGRLMMLRWAAIYLGWLGVVLVVGLTRILPDNLADLAGTVPAGEMGIARTAAYGAMLIVLAFFAVLPVLMLVLLNRPHVRDAFNGIYEAAPVYAAGEGS